MDLPDSSCGDKLLHLIIDNQVSLWGKFSSSLPYWFFGGVYIQVMHNDFWINPSYIRMCPCETIFMLEQESQDLFFKFWVQTCSYEHSPIWKMRVKDFRREVLYLFPPRKVFLGRFLWLLCRLLGGCLQGSLIAFSGGALLTMYCFNSPRGIKLNTLMQCRRNSFHFVDERPP